ncbi:hypothetical protein Pla22_27530 [Rubripirellula amarantea]|uniref:PKD domain-containing protein n=1 Tax=Rubripirellula amarantea TaxID=2527999 RepID=A0A5C5WXV8_9BACT|nr:Ig-like domain-containing protein [Rubripirellula amarantea]TWT55099.1 hypothetical protein Pla22_27530 [Rubripirellula amarantea]
MSDRLRRSRPVSQHRKHRRRKFEVLEDRRLLAANLVQDIVSANSASAPTQSATIGDVAIFANKDEFGTELWRSDGTASGTFRLADIYEGTSSSYPNGFEPFAGGLVFNATALNDSVPYEWAHNSLWFTDGTVAGTFELVDDFVASGQKAVVDGDLFFSGFSYTYGVGYGGNAIGEVDATTMGTVIIKDDFASNPLDGYFTAAGGKLFFTHYEGVDVNGDPLGEELWASDGTLSGTQIVKDLQDGASYYGSYGSYPQSMVEAGGKLFFTADVDGSGRELWVSDGTASGTFLLDDINVGFNGYGSYYSSNVSQMTESGSLLYFVANEENEPPTLWSSDGTVAGTQQLAGVEYPSYLLDVSGKLFFAATDTAATNNVGTELWSIDGTTGGVVLVKDIAQGTNPAYSYLYGSQPGEFTNLNGTLIFTANDGVNGYELWKSDGTTAGTTLITDLTAGYFGSSLDPVATTSNYYYFVKNEATSDLWRTDGTASGTILVEPTIGGYYYGIGSATAGTTKLFFTEPDQPDLFVTSGSLNDKVQLTSNVSSSGSYPVSTAAANGQLYFRSQSKLWTSDGTETGTIEIADSYPFAYSGTENTVGDLGNGTVLFSGQGTDGHELWKTDGTVAGTSQLKDLFPGSFSSYPFNFAVASGTAFFTARAQDSSLNDLGYELWKSDGTAAGTVFVQDINLGISGSYIRNMTAVGNRVYFTARDSSNITQLWTSDGTTTEKVLDVATSTTLDQPAALLSYDNRLFFTDADLLWVADGNQATNLDAVTSVGSSVVGAMESYDGELYFAANSDEIWRTTRNGSGVITGTTMVADLESAAYTYSNPDQLTAVGDTLFFVAYTDASVDQDFELWKIDSGTASVVADVFDGTLYPETNSDYPFGLTAFHDKLIFFADDGVNGIEPWVSDGTAAGTQLLHDIHPVPNTNSVDVYPNVSYNAFFPTVVDDQFFFAADDGLHGREPWRITFPLISADNAVIAGDEGETLSTTGTLRFTSTITTDYGTVIDNGDGTWTWTGSVADGPNTQVVTLTVTDSDGLVATESFTLDVANDAPTIELGASETITPTQFGKFSRLAIPIADAGTFDSQTATIDYGDGSPPVIVNLGPNEDLDLSHVYAVGGVYTISVTVMDSDGDTGSDTLTITVDPPGPDAIDDSALTTQQTNVSISVLTNDAPSGNANVVSHTEADNGTVVDNGDGTFTYTPDVGFTGTDSFDYSIAISDAELVSNAASGGDRFGYSVDVDGDFAVVGSFLDDPGNFTNAGSAFVYQRTNPNSWVQVAQLTGDSVANTSFGWSVAIDGDTVAVSAQYDGDLGFRAGAVYIYDRNEGGVDNWGRVKKIYGDDTVKRDLFGRSIDLSGDTIVVGASTADPLGSASGAAYVFNRDEGGVSNWGQVKKLTGSTQGAGDRFGHSVSIEGDDIAVGAFKHDGVAIDTGAVYIFRRDRFGTEFWGELKAIEAPDAMASDNFGTSVSIHGTTLVVGSPLDDEGGFNQVGSVYVFDRNTGGSNNWGQTAKLLADDGIAGDRFGTTVSFDGNRIVAGSPQADIGGSDSGEAYLFEDLTAGWQQTRILVNEQVTTADQYGIAVAVDGDVAIVGSWLDNRPVNNSGGAYAFDLRTDTATVTVTVNASGGSAESFEYLAPPTSIERSQSVDEVLRDEFEWLLF